MKGSSVKIIDDLIARYPDLESVKGSIVEAVNMLVKCFNSGNKLLVCGNGGSASDALHIVGELMKDFARPRKIPEDFQEKIKSVVGNDAEYIINNLQCALPAISLVGEIALETAYANDHSQELSFAQQVFGYGNAGDVLIGISTSGNSKNIIYAAEVAKVKEIDVIALTGILGGELKSHCDCLINVPETEAYKIQELHLPVYHTLCLILENEYYGD